MCFVSRIDNVTTSGVSALTSNVSLFLDDSGNMVQYYALPKITEIMCQCAENQTSPILQRPSYLPVIFLFFTLFSLTNNHFNFGVISCSFIF